MLLLQVVEPPGMVMPFVAQADGFRYSLKVDLPVTAGMLTAWATIAVLGANGHLAPETCTWCEPNALDTGARDVFRWSDPRIPDLTSNGIAYVGMGALSLSWDYFATRNRGGWAEYGVDIGIVSEAGAAALLLGEVARYSVARERPDVHAAPASEKAKFMPESNTSFPSGHMSFMLAITCSQGILYSRRGYAEAPYWWATGLGLTALTGWFRLAADRHYLTDVLTGSALGVGIGVAVPYLHLYRKRMPGDAMIVPAVTPEFTGLAMRWER